MTFRQLEYIIEVAEQGSISIAARKLMISQPSLSQTIKSIENEFGIILFDRSSVPLIPTKAGTIFLSKAKTILGTFEDLKKEISLTESDSHELHIGISDSAALINKHIFREFQTKFPKIKLILVERDQFMLERMLEAGKLDMIFTMIPSENSNLTVIPLVEDELLIALPKNHPVSRDVLLKYEDLFDENWRQQFYPEISLMDCRNVRFVLSGRDRLKFTQLSALRGVFDPEIGFETDSLASAVSISAYEPHGTVVPKLFSTLYDGPDKPCFFSSTSKLPNWSFALSLRKDYSLSKYAYYYIDLFVRYIETLGLLSNNLTTEKVLKIIKNIE